LRDTITFISTVNRIGPNNGPSKRDKSVRRSRSVSTISLRQTTRRAFTRRFAPNRELPRRRSPQALPPKTLRELGRTAAQRHAAGGDDHELVNQCFDFLHHVARKEHAAPLRPQLAQPIAQVPRGHDVEAVRRLVEQEMLRVVNQRARERDLGLLALRESFGFAARDRAELEPFDQRVDARSERPFHDAVQTAVVLDVLAAGELLIQPRAVRQHAEHAPHLERGGGKVEAADARRTALGFEDRR
jgi:hypothetical protein